MIDVHTNRTTLIRQCFLLFAVQSWTMRKISKFLELNNKIRKIQNLPELAIHSPVITKTVYTRLWPKGIAAFIILAIVETLERNMDKK